LLKFGVVTLNWNNVHETVVCLDSLFAAEPRPDHIVVVDNGSTDDSVERITNWGIDHNVDTPERLDEPWLTILSAGTNRGFAGGNNVGIRFLERRTDVSHIMLLNNDATVATGFFADIARALLASPGAGLITGTIMEEPRRDKVWYAGGTEYPWRALVKHRYEVPEVDTPVPTDFVTGCAMVISRPLLERIGPLAECYFPLYWEDGEYSYRARSAGFPVLYAPAAKVYHKVGATVGVPSRSSWVAYYENRLRVFYVRRNYRGWIKWAALGYLAVTKPGRALRETIKGRPAVGWAVLKGAASGFLSADARS